MILSIFRGGFDLQSAEQIAGASLADMASLVDKSMVQRTASNRYDLHELLKQYAGDKLQTSGQAQDTPRQHFAYFLKLAEDAVPRLQSSERTDWLKRLEAEHDNLRTALRWNESNNEGVQAGLSLVGALYWFWQARGYLSEGRACIESALARSDVADHSEARAQALFAAGGMAWYHGDYDLTMILRALGRKKVWQYARS
jgi:predicted ATPase